MYALAENLGMTVARLGEELTWSEFQGWCLFFEHRAREEKKAASRKGPNLLEGGADEMLKGFGLR